MSDKAQKEEEVKNMAEGGETPKGILGILARRNVARQAEADAFDATLAKGAAQKAELDSQAVRGLSASLKPDAKVQPTVDPNAPSADIATPEGDRLRRARAGLKNPVPGIRPRSGS